MADHWIRGKEVTEQEWKKMLDDICNPIMQGDISPLSIAAELVKRFNDQMEELDRITR